MDVRDVTGGASSSLASLAATQTVAAMAGTSQQKKVAGDVPASTGAAGYSAPALAAPTLNARSMMLALMALQGNAEDANVGSGLEQCENQQNNLEQTLKERNAQMKKYYATMGNKKASDTAMGVLNIVLAIAMGVLGIFTGGASVAGMLAIVGAVVSLTNSVTSLPDVQTNMSETAQKVLPMVLGLTSLVLSASSLGGAFSGKGMTVLCGANKGVNLAQNMKASLLCVKNSVQTATGLIQIGTTATMITSSVLGLNVGESQSAMQRADASEEKIQASLSRQTNTLNAIMDNYATVVSSTASMIAQNSKALNAALSVSA